MVVTWNIENLDRLSVISTGEKDIIRKIHWKVTNINDNGNEDTSRGTVKILKLGSGNIIPFKDVTEDNCIAWAKYALGIAKVNKIENKLKLEGNDNDE